MISIGKSSIKFSQPKQVAVVISTGGKGDEDTRLKQEYELNKEDQKLTSTRDPQNPLKFLIVTAKLTGFLMSDFTMHVFG